MSNIAVLLVKDIKEGLRSGSILAVLFLPVFASLAFQYGMSRLVQSYLPKIALYSPDMAGAERLLKESLLELTVASSRQEAERMVMDGKVKGAIIFSSFSLKEKMGIELLLDQSLPVPALLIEAKVKDAVAKKFGMEYPVDIKVSSVAKTGDQMGMLDFWILLLIGMVSLILVPHSIGEEKNAKTLRALLLSPAREEEFVASKVLFAVILCSVTVFAMLLANKALLQAEGLALAVVIAVGIIPFLGMGLLISLLVDNQEAVLVFSGVLMLVLFLGAFLGSLFAPRNPLLLALPSYHTYEGLKSALYYGRGLSEIYAGLLVPLAWGLVLFLANVVTIKRKM